MDIYGAFSAARMVLDGGDCIDGFLACRGLAAETGVNRYFAFKSVSKRIKAGARQILRWNSSG